jgi:hypothetical protein
LREELIRLFDPLTISPSKFFSNRFLIHDVFRSIWGGSKRILRDSCAMIRRTVSKRRLMASVSDTIESQVYLTKDQLQIIDFLEQMGKITVGGDYVLRAPVVYGRGITDRAR